MTLVLILGSLTQGTSGVRKSDAVLLHQNPAWLGNCSRDRKARRVVLQSWENACLRSMFFWSSPPHLKTVVIISWGCWLRKELWPRYHCFQSYKLCFSKRQARNTRNFPFLSCTQGLESPAVHFGQQTLHEAGMLSVIEKTIQHASINI